MNQEKLSKLGTQVRIGGKGSARRKKKVVHRTATTDDKKLQSSLKKLPVNTIPGIEEVNMIKDDGTLLHFNNPKVQASLAAKTFAITGHAENKQVTEMLPGILNQLGAEAISNLRRLAEKMPATNFLCFNNTETSLEKPMSMYDQYSRPDAKENDMEDGDDDVPELLEDFDTASKEETVEA